MKIALLGDSHSQALFPRLEGPLIQQGYEVISSVSQPGWGVKKFVDQGMATVPPEAEGVVISLGGNNHNLTSDYERQVDRFLASIGPTKRIVWVGPAASVREDVSHRHEWTADTLSKILPSKGIKFIDSRSYTAAGHRDDGVHFTQSGYDYWASQVQRPIMLGLAVSPLMRQVTRISLYTMVGLGTLYTLYFLYNLARSRS